MDFIQNPTCVNEESVLKHFKGTDLYNDVNNYEVIKCNNGWLKVITLTIGGYEHHTDALYHFKYDECDLIVTSPTVSFLDSLNLCEDTKYNRELESPFDKIVFLMSPSKESDIISVLEEEYAVTGLSIGEKRGNNIMIIKEDDSPSREWCECPYNEFCIAKVEKDGMIRMIVLSPSLFLEERCGF